jgi:hypothetical protein
MMDAGRGHTAHGVRHMAHGTWLTAEGKSSKDRGVK